MYYFALLIVALSSATYHLSMKRVSASANPFFVLFVAYFLATLISLVCVLLFGSGNPGWRAIEPSNIGIAIGIFGIEIGFLLCYRAGWNLGYAAISGNH